MGQHQHRTPKRPTRPGASHQPRTPLRERRRTAAHHFGRHALRRRHPEPRERHRKRPLHLQGPGPAPLWRCRHQRGQANRTPSRKTAGIRKRRGNRRNLLHQRRQGTQKGAPAPDKQRHPHPRRIPADRRSPDDDRTGLQIPHRPRKRMAGLRAPRNANSDKHLATAEQAYAQQHLPHR